MIHRLIILLLIVGCVFAEPQLKEGNCILFWLENDTKKEINIEFLNGKTVYDSLMTITYGYKLPIPGLITGYIHFTDNQTMQYQLLDIKQLSINDNPPHSSAQSCTQSSNGSSLHVPHSST